MFQLTREMWVREQLPRISVCGPSTDLRGSKMPPNQPPWQSRLEKTCSGISFTGLCRSEDLRIHGFKLLSAESCHVRRSSIIVSGQDSHVKHGHSGPLGRSEDHLERRRCLYQDEFEPPRKDFEQSRRLPTFKHNLSSHKSIHQLQTIVQLQQPCRLSKAVPSASEDAREASQIIMASLPEWPQTKTSISSSATG